MPLIITPNKATLTLYYLVKVSKYSATCISDHPY